MPKSPNRIRVIGGRWRGRHIPFIDQTDLRPTSDRIRETLFNWLMHDIRGADCLDCFSGSGALGFEAASRGAKSVVMIDQSPQVCSQLWKTIEQFSADNINVIQAQLPNDFKQINGEFDIIFLDPPFHKHLIPECLNALVTSRLLKPESLVYIESERQSDMGLLSPVWRVARSKSAGNVSYQLCVQQKK